MPIPTLPDIESLARQAGAILADGHGKTFTVTRKGRVDLVTEYDKKSEDFLIAKINAQFPGHTILAEESGLSGGLAGAAHEHLWIIDPLDGTTNFAHGVPVFAVSIGYAHRGVVTLGAVFNPISNEMYLGEKGRGATLNGKPLKVAQTADIVDSLLATGFSYDSRMIEVNLAHFNRLQRQAQGIRRLGAAALDLCFTAAGRFDAYWEADVKPWDLAAGGLIAAEAGARVTRLSGEADYLASPCSALAAHPVLHEKLMAELRPGPV